MHLVALIVLIKSNIISGDLVRWASKRPVDGHLLKITVLFFVCWLINCSFEQVLYHILDTHFLNPC